MKRIITIIAVASFLLAFIGTVPVLAEETRVLQGTVNQSRLVSNSCVNNICHSIFQGTGAVNILGPVSWTYHVVQDFNTSPCLQTIGRTIFAGASGSITLADTGSICPGSAPDSFPYAISSNWVIAGGTGEFEGITGSGTSQGEIGGNGPVMHYSGTVSY